MPKVLVEKDKYIAGATGTLLRFQLTMEVAEGVWSRKQGCLACRAADGSLVVLPPAQYFWNGVRKIRYRNEEWSDGLKSLVAEHVEKLYGDNILMTAGVAKAVGKRKKKLVALEEVALALEGVDEYAGVESNA